MCDKEAYQAAAKDNLKRLVDEKLEASKRLKEVETGLSNLEQEYTSLHSLYDKVPGRCSHYMLSGGQGEIDCSFFLVATVCCFGFAGRAVIES
jgi:hypothetical protein